MSERQREHVQIYTQGWRDDAPVCRDDEEPANAYIHCRVFIDGKELVGAISAEVRSSGRDFTEVTLVMSPGKLEWIPLPLEEWEALGK